MPLPYFTALTAHQVAFRRANRLRSALDCSPIRAYNHIMDTYNQTMSAQDLLALAETEFVRLVNTAFRSYHSLLDLSRSPLAHSSLITPALVLDELNPTLDERGKALRIVLQWAVRCLAPTPPWYPLGVARPFADPTWQDPLWWEYNLLRHRYLQPLSPDELDNLGANGFTEALLALTGISTKDRLFEIRVQAFASIAKLLEAQLRTPHANRELRQSALDELCGPLRAQPMTWTLLEMAATFNSSFPQRFLLELANAEGLSNPTSLLGELLQKRLLQQGDNGLNLWMSPPLREQVRTLTPASAQMSRHRRAVILYRERHQPLTLAWHLYMGHSFAEAARTVLEAAPLLVEELHLEELREALALFQREQLPPDLWFAVRVLLSDILTRLGELDPAIETCRDLLKAAKSDDCQAQLYRRLGKLHEDRSQWRALDYYRRAIERYPADDPELPEVLKDRAWIYLHRREWDAAEADLQLALERAPANAWRLLSDIHSALASLYRQQQRFAQALDHAQQALTLREEHGDPQQVAEMCSNLGLIFVEMADLPAAMHAYHEALAIFERLNHREALATVYLNLGMALHVGKQLTEAVQTYQQSLTWFSQLGVSLGQTQACYNLAEALAELGNLEEARRYWQQGREVALEAELDEELRWFDDLVRQYPALHSREAAARPEPPPQPLTSAAFKNLPAGAVQAWELARQEGKLTPRRLIEVFGFSKPTATRYLSSLAEAGLLERRGKGSGVHYVPLPGPHNG